MIRAASSADEPAIRACAEAAYAQYVDAGWPSLACATEYGGQGLPIIVNNSVYEMYNSANQAWLMYAGLSHSAYECLRTHGSDEQKQLYLPKIVSGQWTGTMCLTEPHCGTDLGILRTRAEPQADGSFALSGTKIFISAGEHDMAENILHLVLARLPDAPPGTKGISLFLVPKFIPNADGTLGARNGIKAGSIEHKMGIHGNATCVMQYDGAKGWLVGDEHRGMPAMFVMMNEARLGTGLQGLSIGAAAYQAAVEFANERLAREEEAIRDRPAKLRARSGTSGPRRRIGPAHPGIAGPAAQLALHDVLAGVAAEHAPERARREIHSDFAAGGAHLPAEVAADEADHQVELERKGKKIDILIAFLLAQ